MFTRLKISIPSGVGLKARHDVAFAVLHPQVEVAKRSPTAQIAVGTGVLGLVFTGHLGAAAGLLGAWIGSKPLTHVIAGGLACIGELDAALEKAVSKIPCPAPEVEVAEKPRKPRRAGAAARVL